MSGSCTGATRSPATNSGRRAVSNARNGAANGPSSAETPATRHVDALLPAGADPRRDEGRLVGEREGEQVGGETVRQEIGQHEVRRHARALRQRLPVAPPLRSAHAASVPN